jgi:hypothetical protein
VVNEERERERERKREIYQKKGKIVSKRSTQTSFCARELEQVLLSMIVYNFFANFPFFKNPFSVY